MENTTAVTDGGKKKAAVPQVKVFPNSYEAEQCVLCCLLIDGNVSGEYLTKIPPEAFYNKLNRKIFDTMLEVDKAQMAVDIITVNDFLEKKGEHDSLNYLSELASLLPSGANCQQYVKIITRDMILREVITRCNTIIEDAYNSTDEESTLRNAEKLIFDISNKLTSSALVHISAPAANLIDRMDAMAKDKNAFRGVMTGYPRFDKLTNGLQKGDLVILAARPSVGKTAFALNIVGNIAKRTGEKRVIAVYSLEMPATQIAQRLLSNMANVNMNELNTGELVGSSHKNLWEMTRLLSDSRIFVNDSSVVTPKDVLNQCRKLCCSGKGFTSLDLVVIDYLGLMSNGDARKDQNRQQDVSDMSRMMKIAAKELNCPILLLSQMSRGIENRTDKTPVLSDLRESGAIEQDADIVMFLSREVEGDKEGPVILNVAKHRNGELAQIRFDWAGQYMRFSESENQSMYPVGKKPQTAQTAQED